MAEDYNRALLRNREVQIKIYPRSTDDNATFWLQMMNRVVRHERQVLRIE